MRRWVVWPDGDFPRTSTQKPRRAEITLAAQRALGGDGQGSPAGRRSLTELISQIAKRQVEGVGENARLDADLNLSSLDKVELLGALEDRYQIDLSETGFSAVNTVGDVERMLKGQVAARAVYQYPAWVQRWPVTWLRFIVHYLLLRPAIFVLGWPRVVGRENLRGVSGPVLVICNHIDDVDVGFVQTALPFRIRHKLATATGGEALEALRTPAKDRNFFLKICDRIEWALGVSLLNLFPLPRAAGFRESFAFAGESADRGYSILVFPEGHHTTDGKMRPFRPGVGLLAKSMNIPVVPMRIDGLFEVKRARRRTARPYEIAVKIGRPITVTQGMTAERVTAMLESAVQLL
jgi:long-chain acyl-CoA synthetase